MGCDESVSDIFSRLGVLSLVYLLCGMVRQNLLKQDGVSDYILCRMEGNKSFVKR